MDPFYIIMERSRDDIYNDLIKARDEYARLQKELDRAADRCHYLRMALLIKEIREDKRENVSN